MHSAECETPPVTRKLRKYFKNFWITWMGFAHVIDKCLLAHSDLGGVHIRDDRAQHFSQGDELGLRNGRHLNWRQVA